MFVLRKTKKYSCLEYLKNQDVEHDSNMIHVLVNYNCAYTSAIIQSELRNKNNCICDVTYRASDKINDNVGEDIEELFVGNKCIDRFSSDEVIQLCDFENINWTSVLNNKSSASAYLIRKGLSRKAQLALQLKRFVSKHPSSILKQSVPFTIIIETWEAFDGNMKMHFGGSAFATFDTLAAGINLSLRDRLDWCLQDARDEMEKRSSPLWILKPSVTNKGVNIVLIELWEDVLNALEDASQVREWVLQRYVTNPLLFNGKKFHFRVYVLCTGALSVYVYDNILVLLAAHDYNEANTKDMFVHLTNTARAAEKDDFDETKLVKLMDDLPLELMTTFGICAEEADKKVSQIKQNICNITGELFSAFENEYTVFSPMSNCFELYGLDFMVDANFNVSLLEVNPGPDFKQTGDRLKSVIEGLWKGTLNIIIDKVNTSVPNFTKVYSKSWSVANMKNSMSLI